MKMLDPWKARGLKMADELPRKPLTLADIKTKRYTTAKNGRLLPLNSDAWAKLRRMVLAEQPLCPECEARGLIEPATQVHHINDNAMDNSRSNLVGLCAPCHSRHTAHDMGKRVNHGCDVSGWPANPSSHWNKSTVEAATGLAGDVVGDSQKSPAADSSEPTCSPSFNADCLKNRQS
ncbi:hnh endonuclease [Acidovorax sp. KKS102]|uniref:HNH endonuclease signature motif containing protein n=1 Tax=Acidovorax sp. KKS102 TaxID=358220 RepID=UPI00028A6E99|nr:HNH endonuclease signature motif containing protein [Acidovorax sp. KKS102]AFU46131.1 hnh endonuclease [Acidovorax sp. KKS102]